MNEGRRRVTPPTSDARWWRYPALQRALVAGVLATSAFVLSHAGVVSARVEWLLYLMAIPIGGAHWAREAVERLVTQRVVGIDLLMLAATVGAVALGLWDEAAFLVFLYGAAEALEEYAYERTRSAIRAILDVAPREATVLREGAEQRVPAASLRPGDRFLVRPGETVATDGTIEVGTTTLDESTVTGESVPVDKGPGMAVFAGTANRQGAIEVVASAAFADNTLAKIVRLVEEAQEEKGRAQQWIERFGRVYSPAVLAVAAALVVLPRLAGLPGEPWTTWGVVLLVAAAPCALVMSMPVAMATGIATAGRRGILVKGGAHLEHLGVVKAVAFDKTGTLTVGRPAVTDVVPVEGSAERVLAIAAGIERLSEHPLARAIAAHAAKRGVSPRPVSGFAAQPGAGAEAMVDGTLWHVASPTFFERRRPLPAPIQDLVRTLQEAGKTAVLVGTGDRVHGVIALQDEIRPGIPEIVRSLIAMGVHVVMMTGDNERTAHAVAAATGIDDVWAGLKPEDKVRAVRDLERRSGPVVMVGDGVNDAPALAAATCGVAMGVAGSDAAIEAADVALMAEDLAKVVEALHLGRRVRRISRQNIAFSILVLALLIPAALSGLLGITATVLAHELSELLAVANGLRVGQGKS